MLLLEKEELCSSSFEFDDEEDDFELDLDLGYEPIPTLEELENKCRDE